MPVRLPCCILHWLCELSGLYHSCARAPLQKLPPATFKKLQAVTFSMVNVPSVARAYRGSPIARRQNSVSVNQRRVTFSYCTCLSQCCGGKGKRETRGLQTRGNGVQGKPLTFGRVKVKCDESPEDQVYFLDCSCNTHCSSGQLKPWIMISCIKYQTLAPGQEC